MIPETKSQTKGFWSNGRGRKFSEWLDAWARWPDIIGILVWGGLMYAFAHFAYDATIEGASGAVTFGAGISALIFVLGLAIRYSYYRFVQKRRMK